MESIDSCNCIIGKCAIGAECECSIYCKEYNEKYQQIILHNHVWLTITPKPNKNIEDSTVVKNWLTEFYMMGKKAAEDYIVVVEYTEKMLIHFHLIIWLKDKIKFKKGFLQRWYHDSNIKPYYNRQPVKGIHYLFKTSTEVSLILKDHSIYTKETAAEVVKTYQSAKLEIYKNLFLPGESYD